MAEYEVVNPYIAADDAGRKWEHPLTRQRGPREVYRCPKCGGTLFEVVASDSYETSIRCPPCKIQFVVHDG